MNLYTLMLFLHVSGDIGIFIGIGVWLLGAAALRRADTIAQVRILAGLITVYEPVSVISALLTIATGLYMALAVWGWQVGWTTVALASLIVFLPPILVGVVEPRMHAILKLAKDSPDGPLPPALEARVRDPLLGAALQTMAALVFGIVFLMTIKPSFPGAILTMAVALALGLASGLPLWLAGKRESKIIP